MEGEVLRLGGMADRAGLDRGGSFRPRACGIARIAGAGGHNRGARYSPRRSGPPATRSGVETPATALARGATYIVMGRPILEAADPALKAREILAGIIG